MSRTDQIQYSLIAWLWFQHTVYVWAAQRVREDEKKQAAKRT